MKTKLLLTFVVLVLLTSISFGGFANFNDIVADSSLTADKHLSNNTVTGAFLFPPLARFDEAVYFNNTPGSNTFFSFNNDNGTAVWGNPGTNKTYEFWVFTNETIRSSIRIFSFTQSGGERFDVRMNEIPGIVELLARKSI